VVLARRDAGAWAITATNNADAPRTVTITLPDGAPTGGWSDALARKVAKVDTRARTLTLVVPARFGLVLASDARIRASR